MIKINVAVTREDGSQIEAGSVIDPVVVFEFPKLIHFDVITNHWISESAHIDKKGPISGRIDNIRSLYNHYLTPEQALHFKADGAGLFNLTQTYLKDLIEDDSLYFKEMEND